jgi:hypothetical protein
MKSNNKAMHYIGWLALIVALIFVAFRAVKGVAVDKAANYMTDTYLTKMADEYGKNLSDDQKAKVKDVYSKMSNKDKATVKSIISSHADMETVQKLQKMASDGDKEGLKEYANKTLTADEKKQLLDMYTKYVENASN